MSERLLRLFLQCRALWFFHAMKEHDRTTTKRIYNNRLRVSCIEEYKTAFVPSSRNPQGVTLPRYLRPIAAGVIEGSNASVCTFHLLIFTFKIVQHYTVTFAEQFLCSSTHLLGCHSTVHIRFLEVRIEVATHGSKSNVVAEILTG